MATAVPALGPASGPYAELAKREPLILAATGDNYPFSFQDSHGRLDGFAVDLFDAVAQTMNLRVERIIADGNDISARFAKGEFDCLQVYSQSPLREPYTDFTVPYFTLQPCVFVRDNGPIHALAGLNGRGFAIVGAGSQGESFLAAHRITARVYHASSALDALRAVASGKCDGMFLSRLTALSVMTHEGIRNLHMLGDPIRGFDVRQCFAVHRGDAQLLARLNEGLAIIHRTGQYEEIYRKWYGRIDSPLFTREEVIGYVAAALAIAFIVATWGFLHQRFLRQKLGRQAAELASQRALLAALYDHLPLAMTVLAVEPAGGRIVSINRGAGRLYGIEPEEATGRLLSELPASAAASRQHWEDVLRRRPAPGRIEHFECRLEQDRRILEVTIVALSLEAPGALRLCVLAEDVTAQRQMDAEIAQSRKLRAVGELVGGIAHEFNNLLTPVMLKVGEIQLRWSQDAKLEEEISVIAKSVRRAAELTRRLLTFGRKSEVPSEAVHLSVAVAGCFDLLRSTVDRRIIWASDVPLSLPPLQFNTANLNQIILHLLMNARDTLVEKLARPHDPTWVPLIHVDALMLPAVTAEARKPGPGGPLLGWQRITVRDNGLGMAPDVVDRIFEPFFTTKEVGQGTGLGLATVWHLVHECGGRVDLESTPGMGSSFHLLLPVWRPTETAAPKLLAPPAPARSTASVLLIEDDALVTETARTLLSRGGHEVRAIADGAEAGRHLASAADRYDLLVIDVNLPGWNGIDLIARVRAQSYGGRILVMSGRLAPADLRALSELRVDRVLAKPFNAEQFEAAVVESLAGARPEARPALDLV